MPVNMFDPIEVARASPYFKRNHVGKVTCTLCNVACSDENNFMKHVSGKTHTLQLERAQRRELRRQRLDEEERLNAEAAAQAQREKAARELAKASSNLANSSSLAAAATAGSPVTLQVGRLGIPLYSFRTEHDSIQFVTRVWIDFIFDRAEEGTRPLHRWLSAREQQVEVPADEYFVYLVVACEGYTTVSMKFPANALRTQEGDLMPRATTTTMVASALTRDGTADSGVEVVEEEGGATESAYLCSWDSVKKVYSLFFVLSK